MERVGSFFLSTLTWFLFAPPRFAPLFAREYASSPPLSPRGILHCFKDNRGKKERGRKKGRKTGIPPFPSLAREREEKKTRNKKKKKKKKERERERKKKAQAAHLGQVREKLRLGPAQHVLDPLKARAVLLVVARHAHDDRGVDVAVFFKIISRERRRFERKNSAFFSR